MMKNDCFGWMPEKLECSALNVVQKGCGTVDCPFYKPADKRDYVRKERYNPQTMKVEVSFEPQKRVVQ